ncbi:MAG: hypothetical protein ACOC9D_04680, partial [Thermodesulfobacteriota bacterium]
MNAGKNSKQDAAHRKSPFFQKSLGFRSRFLIGTALSLLLVCFFGAFLIYNWEKKQLVDHAYEKTRLVMAAVEAGRE